MKKSITKNRFMTVEEVMNLYVYRPYREELQFKVDEEERIYVKGETWLVTLDHKTGDFSFSGELHKYYEIDTIESIRDSFGDIYSVFNVRFDTIPVDTWFTIKDTERGKSAYEIQYSDEETKKKMLEYKRDYYWAHKEEINKRQREYYRKKKNI